MDLAAYIAVLIASLVGLVISLYFTLVYYGKLAPDARWIPQFCSLDDKSCATIIHQPQARLLKFAPNFVLGLGYYSLVIAIGVLGLAQQELPTLFLSLMAVGSWLIVGMSVYLAYALIKVLRVRCVLCFTSHICNLVIAVSLLLLL
ncbi:MAG: hypothetical protein CL946_09260 [Ectothiorhodospiraceae bacterium]|nr:hypothetical protein [Ectothiorhodospiraceae bacterium]